MSADPHDAAWPGNTPLPDPSATVWPIDGMNVWFTDGMTVGMTTAGTASNYVVDVARVESTKPELGYHIRNTVEGTTLRTPTSQPTSWPIPAPRTAAIRATFVGFEVVVVMLAAVAWHRLRIQERTWTHRPRAP